MTKKFILIGAKPQKEKAPNPGGQLTASIGIIDYLGSLGHEVEVIDTTQSSFPIPPIKERLFRGLSRVKQLFDLLRHQEVSGVIIFSSNGFSFYERIFQSLICRLFRAPDIFFIRSGHFINSLNRSIYKRFIARILLKIPKNIGAQGKNWVYFYEFLGVDKNKVHIVRNWLSPNFPITKKTKECKLGNIVSFIYVGWLTKEKGVPQLLDAVKKLKNKYKFELHLVGGGTLESFCHDFKNHDLDSILHIYGWQDKHDVIRMLNRAHVFILPSEAEGFPNALLEAISLGLPAICTDVGGVSDGLLDNHNGFLLESNESSKIYDAMKKYLDSPALINKHSESSMKIYHKYFDREKNCKVLLNIFTEK
jgi:glycosyltransferase involved in cell wall biosynthesis